MSDFNVQVKVRNGRLLRAIRERYGSVTKMSRQSGINLHIISLFVNLKYSPILRNGDWSEPAFDVSSALRCEPEDLWPEQLKRIAIRRNVAEIDASADQLVVEGPERMNMIRDCLTKALKTSKINDRNRFALQALADGLTLEETGIEMNVSRERVRQLAAKAVVRTRSSKFLCGLEGEVNG